MIFVSQLIQQRALETAMFSSAVFCLWLTLASLVPLLDLIV